ncbi:hypothetical protein [Haloferula rosea]|uniref:Uncharacterized protein n=1 Tax=Haloferula rosea TaxID=490093 RepID=A0A934REP1_9BACT|nr:hypothetical protein [Haloferula rosea]MBK1827025.1 hypothetical protein [Haloferula rosea]
MKALGLLASVLLTLACPESLGARFDAAFDTEETKPGGLVVLELTQTGDVPEKVEWSVPRHAMLRLVAREEIPVRKNEDDLYVSGERWVLQAVRSGKVDLKGVAVRTEDGKDSRSVALQDVSLVVLPFPIAATSNEPEAWPDEESESTVPRWAIIVGLVGLVLAVGFWWLKKRPEGSGVDEVASAASEVDFVSKVRRGEVTRSELQGYLLRHGESCSPSLRQALEKAAYARSLDVESLLGQLDKEVAR